MPPDAAPDDELPCPVCGYDLRGSPAPRCPECGTPFDAARLRAALDERHPILFEHHAEANVRSFVHTAIGTTIAPTLFWRSIRVAHPVDARRLVIYWAVAMALSLHVLLVEYAVAIVSAVRLIAPRYARLSYWQLLLNLEPLSPKTIRAVWRADATLHPLLFITAANLVWPWATLLVLRSFANPIGPHNLAVGGRRLRCLVYSSDASLGASVAFSVLTVGFLLTRGGPLASNGTLVSPLLWLAALAYAWNLIRLMVAYRIFLQVSDAVSVVVVSQLQVALIVFILFVVSR